MLEAIDNWRIFNGL